MAEKLLSWH